MNSFKIGPLKETCTACAGSMILEFAALSRLTGDSIFEVYDTFILILFTIFNIIHNR